MQKSAAALLTGIMLFCSFPPFEYHVFAWIALVPLIYLCFSCKPGESFLYGLLSGAVFWLASIFWLTHVSYIGWMFISLYCAVYVAGFAAVVSWWIGNFHKAGPDCMEGKPHGRQPRFSPQNCHIFQWNDLIFILGIPAIWVGIEYARSHFLTGFPWNLLGVSQYSCARLIQCADLGGVYLVSYLLIMGNTVFALLIYHRRKGVLKPAIGLAAFLLILFLTLEYGKWRMVRSSEKLETIRTAAIQCNVPQQLKWSEEWADDICRRLKEATEEACRAAPLDLIVWPETALPDYVRFSGPSRTLLNDSLRHGVPILVGSMDIEKLPGKTNYFNSSLLFFPGQGGPQAYAKRHLVFFGEYVPFGDYLPFLRSIAGVEDITPGTENVVFRFDGGNKKFSVLICFEDTLPYLARECVKAGARLLINQTNDAWFDPSWASRQHMTHCIFRCVENRVACLRSTNTGTTCLIDRFGIVRSTLLPLQGSCGDPEFLLAAASFSPGKMPLTFYTRHGDIFAIACAAFSLPIFFGVLLGLLRKRTTW